MKYWVIGIIIIAVIGIGGIALSRKSTKTAQVSNAQSSTPQPAPPQPESGNSAQTAKTETSQSGVMNVSVKANDEGATPATISAKKGQKVNLTFNVKTDDTYHGGLEFTSEEPQFDSGPIAPGSSKTISFTAGKSFSIQPWWPQKQIKKDYVISITEQ